MKFLWRIPPLLPACLASCHKPERVPGVLGEEAARLLEQEAHDTVDQGQHHDGQLEEAVLLVDVGYPEDQEGHQGPQQETHPQLAPLQALHASLQCCHLHLQLHTITTP